MEMRFKVAWAISLVLLIVVLMMPNITTYAVKPGGNAPGSGGGGQGNPPPIVSTVYPTTATQNQQTQFKVNASDNKAVSSCEFFWSGASQGAMSLISGTNKNGVWGRYFTPTGSGTFTARADCTDNQGKKTTGPNTQITVNPQPDTQAPVVSAVTPTSASANVPTNYSVTASDNVGVTSCNFYWDYVNRGAMTLSGGNPQSGTWSKIYTENATGLHAAYAGCSDAAGNTGYGQAVNVTVS
ncbi:TPA: hypothetical protein H1005_03155 [archaeon]|uniref:Ig-like domain-containing protein n=1 Tax=Candidatus Naiadarchaeum limnaeum TaxID=2756139 RepID=A0A832XIJ3_9ARCH|nr:hypothetical protein [Candidatus Naiadarchaeales archaeon SRR2090153.bin1042]HIK00831.1 hypothetical protein [Candidatus Naiadarchaeum limnaeum]